MATEPICRLSRRFPFTGHRVRVTRLVGNDGARRAAFYEVEPEMPGSRPAVVELTDDDVAAFEAKVVHGEHEWVRILPPSSSEES